MILKNIKESYCHIPYTWKHKMAMIKLEKKFTGKNTLRIILHDTDKLVTYVCLPFLTLHQHKVIHRKLNKHHHYDKIAELSDSVLCEIVLDWESAHYTKEDKPETAVDFCLEHKLWCYEYLLPIFKRFGLKK